jgi:hypothetical protein
MYYFVYLSIASNWPDEAELKSILATSRHNNHANNITGILLYGDGRFIQVLEGDKEQIQETYLKIHQDHRHTDLTPISTGDIKERNFPNWSMGFKSIGPTMLSDFAGYINPLGNNLSTKSINDLPIKLLKSFIRNNKMDL